MATNSIPAGAGGRDVPLWLCLLLGVVLVVAGFVVLQDVVVATVFSTLVIGICAIAGGIFEIIHAFWTKGWGGFIWQIILGLLYVIAGVMLVNSPVVGSLVLTYVLGIVLLVSGIVRVVVGIRNWSSMGWLLLLSGVFGVLAGLIILAQWPYSGLWVLGLFLGIDLVFHGVGWLLLAFSPARRAI